MVASETTNSTVTFDASPVSTLIWEIPHKYSKSEVKYKHKIQNCIFSKFSLWTDSITKWYIKTHRVKWKIWTGWALRTHKYYLPPIQFKYGPELYSRNHIFKNKCCPSFKARAIAATPNIKTTTKRKIALIKQALAEWTLACPTYCLSFFFK